MTRDDTRAKGAKKHEETNYERRSEKMNSNDHMTAEEYQEYIRTGRMPERMMQKKQSKYHNEKTVIDGKRFDSKKEGGRYAELRLLDRAKEVVRFFEQVPFLLTANIEYIADFVVLWADGHYTVEDVKGVRTDVYIMKKKLFREKYGFDIVEL